jgi:LmbE family N-acetylglucosaminyl deacetylase
MTKSPLALAACTALLALTLILAPARYLVHAQNRTNFLVAAQQGGHIALGLAVRKLGVSGTFVQVPAHPDDEHNALHALFAHGMGLRSITLQATRGEGGQNEIGPELFRDMGVLRTSELLAVHRIDGAEQYFTRAIDYGYSFDPEEVIGKWGRDAVVGDMVRLIRRLRPDVMLTMNIQGRGGDRAHEATTIVAREAYRAAGDPAKFPEQIAEGLRPWQPKKLYFAAGFGGPPGGPGGRGGRGGERKGGEPKAPAGPPPKLARPNTAMYDPLLGRTYAEIGSEARSNHKCQGMGGLPPLAGQTGGRGGGAGGYQLMETALDGQKGKDETSLFEGIDTRVEALAQYAAPNPPEALISGLAALANAARRAQMAFDSGKDAEVAAAAEAGLSALRDLRGRLGSMGLSDLARYEIDFRLAQKEHDYEDAVLAAHGLSVDAVADDGLIIPGQKVKVTLVAVNRGAGEVRIADVGITGFDGGEACKPATLKKDGVFNCSAELRVPKNAAPTTPYFNDSYWKNPENHAFNEFKPEAPFGVPFEPSPFRVLFRINMGAVALSKELPVQYRYIHDTYTGDKRMELNVVPAFSVRVSPTLAVIPESTRPVSREIHVAVTNGAKGAAQGTVTLDLPDGWKAMPASVPLRFVHEDESLSARFQISAPMHVKPGEYALRAIVTSGDQKFATGYQDIEYPHVQRRQVIKPAEATVKVIDVKTAANLRVGYIVGVGDQVPAAIEQLGVKLEYIDQDELAWGDLSKHDVIMTGVRAYERRADLRAYNRRLLDYAERGGTVIVQYNKMEFNQADYGPFPAKVSGNRVCDETVPVKVLEPAHPAFNYPNKIGATAWAGWVQERGLYFLGEKDKRYTDLVSMVDSFKDNPGEKRGALVEGRIGKGRWIYLGLALWRQLPAGTSGAYQLMANLISLPKAPAVAAAR